MQGVRDMARLGMGWPGWGMQNMQSVGRCHAVTEQGTITPLHAAHSHHPPNAQHVPHSPPHNTHTLAREANTSTGAPGGCRAAFGSRPCLRLADTMNMEA